MRLSGQYFWILGFALALLLATCGGQGGQSGPSAKVGVASSVTPIPYIPWQAGSAETECAQAGIPFGGAYKVDPPTSGTSNVDAYGHYVTVSFSQDGRYVDWSSNLAISAVIVKGGPNANVYIYNPPATSDTGLRAPDHPREGQIPAISHVTFCWEYRLDMEKTARTTYTRQYFWEIHKSGDQQNLTLSPGQVFPVNYQVEVKVSRYEDRDFAVSGDITIRNNTPITFVVQGVSDVVSPDIQANVSCGNLPQTLAPGETLTCTYTASLPDKAERTNTATATYVRQGQDRVRTATATRPVTFGEPTELVDEAVSVSDDRYGPLGTVSAAEAPRTFTYTLNVGPYACGPQDSEYTFTNTATLTTNDTQKQTNSSWTVSVRVPACAQGCTLTQGYWKTHTKYGPAKPRDDAWDLITPDGEDSPFFLSGQSYYRVLWTPPSGGNPYYQLAHQYIAAKLNVLNGSAAPSEVGAALAWAENFFATHTPSGPFSKTETNQARAYADLLGQYNEGYIGPGHCSE
ncbi:hypothetical protein QT17_11065 [Thermus sp. 2.9]|uniref:hypothetical protein n=1 Tax=Thermus sp. (strain 2.9) TaxID=1577051 RepID=UPI000541B398|nr:hypothetical protein [Thermus sp. 2.9]KHG64665.1 hypothetical protein QT17_11065 [Thermus sp. 2.9]